MCQHVVIRTSKTVQETVHHIPSGSISLVALRQEYEKLWLVKKDIFWQSASVSMSACMWSVSE